jgi:hypothetical protein
LADRGGRDEPVATGREIRHRQDPVGRGAVARAFVGDEELFSFPGDGRSCSDGSTVAADDESGTSASAVQARRIASVIWNHPVTKTVYGSQTSALAYCSVN